MKRFASFVLFLMIFSLGCGLSSGLSAADLKATVNASIVQTQAAMPAPTEPPLPTKAPIPTQAPQKPTQVPQVEPTQPPASGNCTAPALSPSPSPYISKVVLAENTQGANKEPVNPTNVFTPKSAIHVVVTTKSAPANTVYKTIWYATDTNGVAPCNTLILSYDGAASGTRNLDFILTPTSIWPTGIFRAEIYVNDKLDSVMDYTVQ